MKHSSVTDANTWGAQLNGFAGVQKEDDYSSKRWQYGAASCEVRKGSILASVVEYKPARWWFDVGLAWQLVVLNDIRFFYVWEVTLWSCRRQERKQLLIILVNVCAEKSDVHTVKWRCFVWMQMKRESAGCSDKRSDVTMRGSRTGMWGATLVAENLIKKWCFSNLDPHLLHVFVLAVYSKILFFSLFSVAEAKIWVHL